MSTPTDQDELYGLPLEEFTAARNALARELAGGGRVDESRAVRSLPKPTRTAWALNQLARRQPEDVERFLEAARSLREAQEMALGGDSSRLRAAGRQEQELLEQLLATAADVLGTSSSAAGPARERMRKTLRAAALDADIGSRLRQGRLVADMEASGFGLEGFDAAATAAASHRAPDDQRRAEQRRQAERTAARRRREVEQAQQRARRLWDEAEKADQRAKDAQEEADRAAAAAAWAQREADEAAAQEHEIGLGG